MRALASAAIFLLSLSLVTGQLACDIYDFGERCDASCSVRSVGPPRAAVSGGAARALHTLPVAAVVRSLERPPLQSVPPVGQAAAPSALSLLPAHSVLRI